MQSACVRMARLAVVLAAMAWVGAAQDEGNRYALVIGNNSYLASPLQNAVNDARIMEKSLKDAGFKVMLVENSNLVALQSNVGEFLAKLGPADTALFFYAGHGVQIENENFLVPVDFEAASSVVAAKFKLFSVAQLFDGLRNRSRRSIVILDACRSNPIAQQNALTAGLAQPQNPPNESYVVFSTGPGQTAADNPNGRNSYFTEALAMEITKPGMTIEEVVNHVRATVSSETNGKQTPWALSSLKATFFFHPTAGGSTERTMTMSVKWMADAKRFEQREQWDDAIDKMNQVILNKAGGTLRSEAAERLPYLVARRNAQMAFDKGDYAAAAKAYETAFGLDPFAIDAAFEGVNSYLEAEQIGPAVRLLHAIRSRGTSEANAKAMKMLAELKVVDTSAAAEASAEVPPPPPIEELFLGAHFGTPDWDAGKRVMASAPVDPSGALHELEAKLPPPASPDGPGQNTGQNGDSMAGISALLKGVFHVEVVPNMETRDLAIKRASAAGTMDDNTGMLQIEGADAQVPVLYQGRIQRVPAVLPVLAGKYEIRSVENGKVVDTQTVEVVSGTPLKVTIKR